MYEDIVLELARLHRLAMCAIQHRLASMQGRDESADADATDPSHRRSSAETRHDVHSIPTL